MQNFTYSIPTVIHFGRGQVNELGKEISSQCHRVLVVYGGGSIKRNGAYDDVMEQLQKNNIYSCELAGVEPNPHIATVRRGISLCQQHELDGVLAIGGGSAIDCAKTIAAGAVYEGDAWDFPTRKAIPVKALPIFTVLTIAATGSEMDTCAVISNPETHEKFDFSADCCLPACSILDPTYSFSLPAKQTAAGTADIMSHTLENYFSQEASTYFQNQAAEALLRTCIHYGPIALAQPDHYDARANLMWASSWAINGFLHLGKTGAWSVHKIEHELSAFYNVTHGVGLAILTPVWMLYVLNPQTELRFAQYGINVWGLSPSLPQHELAVKAIEKTRAFFSSMNLPSTLRELGVGQENFREMAHKARVSAFDNTFVPLNEEDIYQIFLRAL